MCKINLLNKWFIFTFKKKMLIFLCVLFRHLAAFVSLHSIFSMKLLNALDFWAMSEASSPLITSHKIFFSFFIITNK